MIVTAVQITKTGTHTGVEQKTHCEGKVYTIRAGAYGPYHSALLSIGDRDRMDDYEFPCPVTFYVVNSEGQTVNTTRFTDKDPNEGNPDNAEPPS